MHSLLDRAAHDALFDAVAVVMSFLFGTVAGGRIKQLWQRHEATQHLIADRLDTSTPGGLADVVKAVGDTDA